MILRTAYQWVGYYLTLLFFGLFGFALSLLGLVAGLLPSTARTERGFQRLIHRLFALFVWWVDLARFVHIRLPARVPTTTGGTGLVYVANHPSLIDITCVLARVPEAMCVFKPAIRRNPVLGAAARRAGYLANDGGFEVLREAARRVASGHSIVIFPEGTRTPAGGGVQTFKPGFVLVARRAGAPLQLVRLRCSPPLMTKDIPWWRAPEVGTKYELVLGPRLEVTPAADTAAATAEIEAWFRATPEAAACHVWSPAFRLSPRTDTTA